MSQSDDEAWEKVREMVRNSPPGTAQPQFQPHQHVEEPSRRFPAKKVLVAMVLLAAVAGVAYFATEHGPQILGTAPQTSSPKNTGDSGGDVSGTPQSATTPPVVPVTASIKKRLKSVNVRSSPSSGSASLARLNGGDSVEIISDRGDWVRIRFGAPPNTGEGWVSRNMLGE